MSKRHTTLASEKSRTLCPKFSESKDYSDKFLGSSFGGAPQFSLCIPDKEIGEKGALVFKAICHLVHLADKEETRTLGSVENDTQKELLLPTANLAGNTENGFEKLTPFDRQMIGELLKLSGGQVVSYRLETNGPLSTTTIEQELRKAYDLGRAYGLGMYYAHKEWLNRDAKEEDWKTINGAHVLVGKNGKLQGWVGRKIEEKGKPVTEKKHAQSRPRKDLTKTSFQKSPEEYLKEANNNVRKAITDCFRKELLGGYVKRRLEVGGQMVEVEISFTNRTLNEFKKYTNENTLLALPKVAEIIATGSYGGRSPEPDHLPEVAFHTIMKRVDVGRVRKLVAVGVGESATGSFYAYSINQIGQPTFPDKKAKVERLMRQRKMNARDGQTSPIRLEVLGIRFLD